MPTTMTTEKMKMRAALRIARRAGVEMILQDDRGGHGVDLCLPGAPVLLTRREAAFGFHARQPLVLHDDVKAGARAKRVGESLYTRGHVVRAAVEAARQAD